jgi:hypothetical protein
VIYRIYPMLLFGSALLTLMGTVALIKQLGLSHFWLFTSPIIAITVGYILTARIAAIFPKIRYVNEQEIDGHGYIHQPLGPLLLVAVIGFSTAIIACFR